MISLNPADYLELLDLYARYTHAFDSGDADTLASLFTEDGAIIRGGSEPVRGKNAIAAMVTTASLSTTPRRHLVSAIHVAHRNTDVASGTAYVTVVALNDDSVLLTAIGTYVDEFARHNGEWLIHRREFISSTSPTLIGAPLATSARSVATEGWPLTADAGPGIG